MSNSDPVAWCSRLLIAACDRQEPPRSTRKLLGLDERDLVERCKEGSAPPIAVRLAAMVAALPDDLDLSENPNSFFAGKKRRLEEDTPGLEVNRFTAAMAYCPLLQPADLVALAGIDVATYDLWRRDPDRVAPGVMAYLMAYVLYTDTYGVPTPEIYRSLVSRNAAHAA